MLTKFDIVLLNNQLINRKSVKKHQSTTIGPHSGILPSGNKNGRIATTTEHYKASTVFSNKIHSSNSNKWIISD